MIRVLPVLLVAVFGGGAVAAEPLHLHGITMGPIVWNVKVADPPASVGSATLQRRIEARLERVDALMSTWRDDSEVSRFNRHDGTDWFPVSPETAYVVRRAIEIGRESGGALDVTVAPLVNLWSFGERSMPERVPGDEEIAAAREHVGLSKLDVRDDPPALRKSDPELSVNLSAIAKGYAVDAVAGELDSLGVRNHLVEIGGELRVRGSRGEGRPWRVGVERPNDEPLQIVHRGYVIGDRSLATSGDYRSFFEHEGTRYSHTIDPATGRPVAHLLASVSIVADDCTTADGWATALSVLGPEQGYDSAVEHDVAALLLVRAAEGAGFVERATPAFERLARPVAAPADPAPEGFHVSTYVIAFAVFLVAIAAMSVGVLLSNRRLKGSCGGLSSFTDRSGNPACDACTNPLPTCGGVDEGRARDERGAVASQKP